MVFQSLSALGPHVAGLLASRSTFSNRRSFLSWTIRFFASLALSLPSTSLPFPLLLLSLPLPWPFGFAPSCIGIGLTVDVLLCSRDLENLFSRLIPACDSDAVPDEVLFHSHVLHHQHRHSHLDIVVYGLCGLVLVVVHGSFECCQLGWNVVSESGTPARSPRVPHTSSKAWAPTPSRTASKPQTLRSRRHCDTCPTRLLQLSSPECSTPAC